MNSLLEPLKLIWDLNTRLFLNAIDGVDEGRALNRPNDRTNNIAFIACHLVGARHLLGTNIGVESPLPFDGVLEDVKSVDDMGFCLPVEDIRSEWKRVSEQVGGRLWTMTDQELSAEAKARFPVDDPSNLGMITFLMQHDSYHVGQLALLRRYIGLDAMGYS